MNIMRCAIRRRAAAERAAVERRRAHGVALDPPQPAVEAQRADQRTAADKTGYTTGLTDERVFRDPAFKVGLAMRSLGVARTGAARDAVARLVGPRAMNPITGARC